MAPIDEGGLETRLVCPLGDPLLSDRERPTGALDRYRVDGCGTVGFGYSLVRT